MNGSLLGVCQVQSRGWQGGSNEFLHELISDGRVRLFLGSFLAGFAGFSLVDASLGEVGWTMLASPTASEDFCSCLDLMKEKDRLFL